jgi:predicted dehydrogenase
MSEFKGVRTAVIGCGYWGKNLVRNFAALSDLRMCCDSSSAVRAALSRTYPAVQMTPDVDEVFASIDIEAVVIATPAPTHADLTVAALAAGKHVFVEKPLALSVADGERMARAADEAGRILMVGHLLEYHPGVRYLKELIDSGELGEVYYCYSQRVNLGKLREDENALWSLAPHDISVLLYLMNEEPSEVQATGQAFLRPGVEDVVFATLKFDSGRFANIHVSWLDPHKERRLTVVGSRKMAVMDDMHAAEKIRVYDKGVDRRSTEAAPYGSLGELLALREGDILLPRLSTEEPLATECTEFLKAVVTGTPPLTDAADGLRVLRVLEAAQQQLQQRRMVYEGGFA